MLTGRDTGALERAGSTIGAGTVAIRSDIADPAGGKVLAKELQAQGIRLDAVFANAGITRFAPFPDVTEAFWDESFDTNVKGAYFLLQALLPLINDGASIGAQRIGQCAYRHAGLLRLRGQQGGADLAGEDAIGGADRAEDPGERREPRADLDTLVREAGARPGALEATAASIRSQIPLGASARRKSWPRRCCTSPRRSPRSSSARKSSSTAE